MVRRTKVKTKIYSRTLKRKLKKEGREEDFSVEFYNSVAQSKCQYCAPFQDENWIGSKHGKHGKTKPKYKNKRQ